MAAGCITTLQQWLAAHWYLNYSGAGTDSSCCGECSPALAVTVTIDTLNRQIVLAWLTENILERALETGGGSDGHEERMGS